MARYELNLRDYYRIVRRHMVVIGAAAISLGGITWQLTPQESTFRAHATVRITRTTDMAGLLLQRFSWSQEDNIATQTRLISSQPVALYIAKELGVIDTSVITFEDAIDSPEDIDIITNLAGYISARQIGYTGLIEITAVRDSKPGAIDLAIAAAKGFQEYNKFTASERMKGALGFIEVQLSKVHTDLDSSQGALQDFLEKTLAHATTDLSSITPLIERRSALTDRLISLEKQRDRLREGGSLYISGSPLDSDALLPYADAFARLALLYSDRSRLLLTYTEQARPIRVIDDRIQEARSELATVIDQDIAFIITQLVTLGERLIAYPRDEIQLAEKRRAVDINTQLVIQLETSLLETRIRAAESEQGSGEEVHIINLPTLKSAVSTQQSGRGVKTFIGVLLGLMMGMVLAFILETMDTSIGTIEDVEEYLEVSVLTVIPHLPVDKMAERLIDQNPELKDDPYLDMYARLITQYDPKSPAAEAYRTLRTNLQFATAGAGESMEVKNTFVFTSSDLQEGKSTTLVNLAITIAQAGSRVLLLGCNMRRPTIYRSFGLSLETGMTDILTGLKEWRDCVKGVTDMMVGPLSLQNIMQMPGLDNLHIITSGGVPPNPSELLNSPRFSELIEEAREEYDIVLVDCPPILPVTDAAIVGRQVDWAVLVYQVGKVARNALRRAKFHLENVGARVLGIAMNDVKAEIAGYAPYSQYMTKYYGEEIQKKTLIDKIRSALSRKSKKEEEDPATHMITGPEDDGLRIPVEYYGIDKEADEGEEEAGSDHLRDLPYSSSVEQPPAPDDAAEPETSSGDAGRPGGKSNDVPAFHIDRKKEKEPKQPILGRIPVWGWIVLGIALALLIASTLLDTCSNSGAQALDGPSVTPIQGAAAPAQQEEDPVPAQSRSAETSASLAQDDVWSVQIGSFRSQDGVASLLRSLPGIQLPVPGSAWTRLEEVPGLGVWNRVFFGQYRDRETCERTAQILRDSGEFAIAMVRRVSPPTP